MGTVFHLVKRMSMFLLFLRTLVKALLPTLLICVRSLSLPFD